MKKYKLLYILMVVILISGCGVMDLIKDKTPLPHKIGEDAEGKVIMRFTYDAPAATQVWMAGEFNNWTTYKTVPPQGEKRNVPITMKKDPKSGFWIVDWPIPSGRFAYKFIIDSDATWKHDPMAPEKVDDGFGGYNSIITVK